MAKKRQRPNPPRCPPWPFYEEEKADDRQHTFTPNFLYGHWSDHLFRSYPQVTITVGYRMIIRPAIDRKKRLVQGTRLNSRNRLQMHNAKMSDGIQIVK